jgi:hypothetical protein
MTTSRWGRRVPFQDVVDVAGVKVAFSGDFAEGESAAIVDVGEFGEVGAGISG